MLVSQPLIIFMCCLMMSGFTEPIIYVIGDSHSLEFKNSPNIVIRWIGPITIKK
jgi:hypothetical protein